jgi:hypothetical protein
MPFIAADCYYTPWSRWVNCFISGCAGEFAVEFKHAVHRGLVGRWQGWRPWNGGDRRGAWGRQSTAVPFGCVPTVTCYYPQAPAAYIRIAKGYASPGKFVHAYLYRILPYQLIRNPCPVQDCGVQVACCPSNTLPTTLYGTITGSGNMDGSYPFVWNATDMAWENAGAFGTCANGLRLVCNGSNTFTVERFNGISWIGLADAGVTLNCGVFDLVFSALALGGPLGCGATSNATMEFTT